MFKVVRINYLKMKVFNFIYKCAFVNTLSFHLHNKCCFSNLLSLITKNIGKINKKNKLKFN